MARVFTIEFPFQSFWFRALITLTDGSDGLIISIRVFDTDSIRILGTDRVAFTGLHGHRKDPLFLQPEAQDLLETIHNTVLQHLNRGE